MDKQPSPSTSYTRSSPLVIRPVPLRPEPSSNRTQKQPSLGQCCFILPEQYEAAPEYFLDPADGECISPESFCRCGTWYFQTLPESLGGCGHIYKIVQHSCNGSGFFACLDGDLDRKIRPAYYLLGLCQRCQQKPEKVAKNKDVMDMLSRADTMDGLEEALKLVVSIQDFFDKEHRSASKIFGFPGL